MLVEMMRPEASKSAAIAFFEALCNLWRSLRWLLDTRPSLRQEVAQRLKGFVATEAQRHKEQCGDLGVLLVLYTALQGYEACPRREDFLEAYVDEPLARLSFRCF